MYQLRLPLHENSPLATNLPSRTCVIQLISWKLPGNILGDYAQNIGPEIWYYIVCNKWSKYSFWLVPEKAYTPHHLLCSFCHYYSNNKLRRNSPLNRRDRLSFCLLRRRSPYPILLILSFPKAISFLISKLNFYSVVRQLFIEIALVYSLTSPSEAAQSLRKDNYSCLTILSTQSLK